VSPVNDLRGTISWLLLVLLAVVGGGAAVLGVSQAPKNVSLPKALANTKAATSYNMVFTEVLPQGKETDYLTYQAPSTVGGYVVDGNKRRYVYIIGGVEYQSVTVPNGTSAENLTFYKQPARGGSANLILPYLGYASSAKHITQSGTSYTFVLTQSGESANFTYTVSGKYVSSFGVTAAGQSVHVVVSQVGTAAHVALPKGAKIVEAPSQPAT
jgi:hypothetical protein